MIINAVIESKDGGTLVLDFPRSIYDVYEKLQSVGIRQSPHQITLSDEEGDDVRVKLYSEDETGKHMSPTRMASSPPNTMSAAPTGRSRSWTAARAISSPPATSRSVSIPRTILLSITAKL